MPETIYWFCSTGVMPVISLTVLLSKEFLYSAGMYLASSCQGPDFERNLLIIAWGSRLAVVSSGNVSFMKPGGGLNLLAGGGAPARSPDASPRPSSSSISFWGRGGAVLTWPGIINLGAGPLRPPGLPPPGPKMSGESPYCPPPPYLAVTTSCLRPECASFAPLHPLKGACERRASMAQGWLQGMHCVNMVLCLQTSLLLQWACAMCAPCMLPSGLPPLILASLRWDRVTSSLATPAGCSRCYSTWLYVLQLEATQRKYFKAGSQLLANLGQCSDVDGSARDAQSN